MNALHAGILQVYFTVDRDEAAAHGFDYRGTYALFVDDPQIWQTPAVGKLVVPEGSRPFLEFRSEAAIARRRDHLDRRMRSPTRFSRYGCGD